MALGWPKNSPAFQRQGAVELVSLHEVPHTIQIHMDDNGCHVLQIKKPSWTQGPRTHLSKVVGIINVTQERSASRCIRCPIYIHMHT